MTKKAQESRRVKPSPATLRRFIAGATLSGIHLDTRKPALRALAEAFAVESAYHEAGHLVASAFSGGYDFKECALTIIPDATARGTCAHATDCTESHLRLFPPTIRRRVGMRVLLHLLAGRATAYRVTPPNLREAVLDPNTEEWRIPWTDLNRAKKTARLIAGRKQTPAAVLKDAARITEEMLDLPEVWGVVERLAARLLAKGTISGEDTIRTLCDPILDMSMKFPAWWERLHSTPPARNRERPQCDPLPQSGTDAGPA